MKLFIILSRVPYPLDKGDKLRAYHQIKHLNKNHEVFLCCLNDQTPPTEESLVELKKVCTHLSIIPLSKLGIIYRLLLSFFSSKPFQVNYFYQRTAHKKIKQLIKTFKPQHIYCQLIRVSEYVKNYHEIPKTLDYMDALSKGMERRVKSSNFLAKQFFSIETKRLRLYENLIFDYFENTCIISSQDQNLIFHPKKKKIEIIPNGVDTQFFAPVKSEKKYDLVFIGNMNYPPNINGAIFLAKEIFPLLQQQHPTATLLISGTNPHSSVRELANKSIKVSGWVNDIRDSYRNGKIFIAPMQIGTGLQNKLLEAMAMGIPCITSKLANNALGAVPENEILIGNSPSDYVTHIVNLLGDDNLRNRLTENGHEFVKQNFDWKISTQKLEGLFCSFFN